jgi:biopolymer transport protein ExbB
MYEFFIKGGPIVIPIGICSIVSLGVFLERLWSLQRSKIIPEAFISKVEGLIRDNRMEDALELTQDNANPMARIIAAALRNRHEDRGHIKESVEDVGRRESALLERYVEILGTCAAIAPLLGLLGTVTGMMDVFQQVEAFGLGDPSVFASGIWKALITTAIGLSVAIPSFIFYKSLIARVDALIIEMEERSLNLVEMVVDA